MGTPGFCFAACGKGMKISAGRNQPETATWPGLDLYNFYVRCPIVLMTAAYPIA
jgi:hypothetical protein